MGFANGIAEQYKNLLADWIPQEATLAIAVGDSYIYYVAGAYDVHLNCGKGIKEGSIADQVIRERRKIEAVVEEELLGIPYYGIGYPIELHGEPAALIVILPPDHKLAIKEPYRFITGKQQDEWSPIPIEKVSHFESLNKKSWFYAKSEQYKTNLTLKELHRRLPDCFLRIHRSYIVNIHSIRKITRDFSSNLLIVLQDNTELPVSSSYINDVKRALEF
ncbi:LytTR family transcriptional regulator [Viridibacillus sp. YIM B01967]|uniref:LytTR family transcriptional regulator n=2 Tax=Viridibacillus soli TaxID=2798301 RepID=A0ABS1H7W1_9BACL|nr:LytTR family transcriptional regulator [Viridibacillus soli]